MGGEVDLARREAEIGLRLDEECASAWFASSLLSGELKDPAAMAALGNGILAKQRALIRSGRLP